MKRWTGVAAAMALALAAGPASAIEVVVPPPITLQPLPAGAKPKPIALTRVAANIAPGTPWAEEAIIGAPVPIPCAVDVAAIVTRWEEANNRIRNIDSFERIFRQELSATGFTLGGDRTNLFEEQQAGDLQLGALITDMRVKSCSMTSIMGETVGGSAVMTIEWQIYSVVQGRVVARITTRGGTTAKQARNGTAFAILLNAFGDNVRRLSADPQFRELVLAADVAPPAVVAPTAVRFARPAGRVTVATATQSVVAIFAGGGHGSGVVISPDGYILTNHHVAGSGGQVRVRWADGTETVGDVVRADRRRDIALIKAPPKAAALAVRHTPAQVGEGVFAIGTPLDAKFQGSVTRGIVSATRIYEGLSFIQSDVVVNGGNSGGPLVDENGAVMGITVSGMEINGAPVGINLFIPIEDALKALALTPAT